MPPDVVDRGAPVDHQQGNRKGEAELRAQHVVRVDDGGTVRNCPFDNPDFDSVDVVRRGRALLQNHVQRVEGAMGGADHWPHLHHGAHDVIAAVPEYFGTAMIAFRKQVVDTA